MEASRYAAPGRWPGRWRRGGAWHGLRQARVTDRLVAVGLLIWALPDVPWWWRPPGHGAATPVVLGYAAIALAQSVPFLWWRRVPLLAAVLASAALAVRTGLGLDPFSAGAATAAGAFGLGAWGGRRTRLAARILTAGAVAATVIVLFTSDGFRVQALPLALLATALGLGEVTAANRDAAAASARLAHDAERSRLARELHDVISHQLSAIAVQAGAARMASRDNPGVAVRAIGGIEDVARQGLIELNRILGALRRDGEEELDRHPQPRLNDLPDLVDGAKAAGLPVRLGVTGLAQPLPATVELAAFRIVQESLTNALRRGSRRDGGGQRDGQGSPGRGAHGHPDAPPRWHRGRPADHGSRSGSGSGAWAGAGSGAWAGAGSGAWAGQGRDAHHLRPRRVRLRRAERRGHRVPAEARASRGTAVRDQGRGAGPCASRARAHPSRKPDISPSTGRCQGSRGRGSIIVDIYLRLTTVDVHDPRDVTRQPGQTRGNTGS